MTEQHELANEVFEKMMEKDYCSQWMGIKAIHIADNSCTLSMQVKKEMLNGFGILHGGIAYAFADSAFAFASNSLGRLSVSINGSMHFHKSAEEGDILYAKANAIKVGYKTADYDVNITDSKAQLLYSFRGTVYRTSRQVLDES
jgi:acyl-CoA thioesterase